MDTTTQETVDNEIRTLKKAHKDWMWHVRHVCVPLKIYQHSGTQQTPGAEIGRGEIYPMKPYKNG